MLCIVVQEDYVISEAIMFCPRKTLACRSNRLLLWSFSQPVGANTLTRYYECFINNNNNNNIYSTAIGLEPGGRGL